MPTSSDEERPWQILLQLLEAENTAEATHYIHSLSAEDQRRALSRLPAEEQAHVAELIQAEEAAHLLEHLPEAQAVDILEEVPASVAAEIVEELPDRIGANLLREMDAEEILSEIETHDESEATHLRELAAFDRTSAGGLMSESFAAFSVSGTVGDVLAELSDNAEVYSDLDVQYVYAVDQLGRLNGVLRLRDLVLTRRKEAIESIMLKDPASVLIDDDLEALGKHFDERDFFGLPVVDRKGVLKGVVSQLDVREALAETQTEDFLRSRGIVQEELRSMPMASRCLRRLSWLGPNIVLNLVAASVIAAHQDTLQAVIALAVFLPIISDMSGCSGNQAVAVSIRELTLGLIRPTEFMRVVWKEGILGIINGIVLGIAIALIAGFWSGNFWLGGVLGCALALNTLLSVLLGGLVPLLLKRLNVDPALASGPILTTCTDVMGFFLVLSLANLTMSYLI